MSMSTKKDCDREHEFVLVLSGVEDLSPRVVDALFEAGCDDATPSLRFGRVYLDFTREAPSLKDAILSAIRDVGRAQIGATVLCVDDGDLVSQAEIARRIKRTRQQVGQYVSGKRGPGNFPGPVQGVADGPSVWRWSEAASWLWENGVIGDEALNEARVVATINAVLEYQDQRRREPVLVEEIYRVVGEKYPARSQ